MFLGREGGNLVLFEQGAEGGLFDSKHVRSVVVHSGYNDDSWLRGHQCDQSVGTNSDRFDHDRVVGVFSLAVGYFRGQFD